MSHPPPPYAQGGSAPMGQRHRLADWPPRLVARIIDAAVLVVPATVAFSVIGFIIFGLRRLIGSDVEDYQPEVLAAVVFFVAFTAYDTVCVRKWRRTLGKYVMKVEVAPLAAAGHQGPIPVFSNLARAAVLHVWLLLAWVGIGLTIPVFALAVVFTALWPLWDTPNRQGVHDKLAGTVVVRAD